MKKIASIEIDLQSQQAQESLDALKSETKETAGIFDKLNDAMAKVEKVGTSAFNKLSVGLQKAWQTSKGFLKTLMEIVGRIKYIALAGLAGVVGSAMGTNSEVRQGAMNKLSFAQQRGFNKAEDIMGWAPNLSQLNEKLATRDYDTDLAALGFNKQELDALHKMDSMSAYMAVANKANAKRKAIGDDQVFNMTYGESVQNLLGMNNSEFATTMDRGILNQFAGIMGQIASVYKNIDVGALQKGEIELAKFWETLRSGVMQLSSKVMPAVTKFTQQLQQALMKIFNSEAFVSAGNAMASILSSMVSIMEKLAPLLDPLLNALSKIFKMVDSGLGNLVEYGSSTSNALDKGGEAYNKAIAEGGSVFTGIKEGLDAANKSMYADTLAKSNATIRNLEGKTAKGEQLSVKEYEDLLMAKFSAGDKTLNPIKIANMVEDYRKKTQKDSEKGWFTKAVDDADKWLQDKKQSVKDSVGQMFGFKPARVDVNIKLDGRHQETAVATLIATQQGAVSK